MKKNQIKEGYIVRFTSGNFEGLHGEVINVDWDSKDPRAIYGFLHTVRLSNGDIAHIEKSEHFEIVSPKPLKTQSK